MFDWSVDDIFEGFRVVLATFMSLLLVSYIFRKKAYPINRVRPLRNADDDLEAPIDYQTLEKAEKAVADIDVRAELAQHYTRIKDFSNMYGYTEAFMNNLVEKLDQQDILAQYLFVQSVPTGVASYTGSTGTFELYVERDKRDQAIEMLTQWGIKN